MATRVKTVEYFFPVDTSTLATATRRDFSAITVYIPESSPTFKSVSVQVACRVDGTSNTTDFMGGIKLGAVAFSDTTVTETISASGEHTFVETQFDFTSYFTTNWSGTSMTCQVGVQYTGNTTSNHSAKLIITYEYDDSATTRLKTVRIPIESTNDSLTTTWETIGSSTPIISTNDLPESTVTVRQAALTFMGSEDTASSTSFTVQYRINGGSANTFWSCDASTTSTLPIVSHVDVTSALSTTAYSLEAQTVTQTDRVSMLCAVLTITYEYDHSSSTSIWNSFMLESPFANHNDAWGSSAGTNSGDENYGETEFWVEESGTLSLKPSGVLFYTASNDFSGNNVKVGSQASYTTRARIGGAVRCGVMGMMHNFDSTASGGSGLSLASGRNTVDVHVYAGSLQTGQYIAGAVIYMNYTSGKTTDDANHNHSVHQHIADSTSAWIFQEVSAIAAIDIPETDYFVNAFIPYGVMYETYGYNALLAYYTGSEGKGASGNGMACVSNAIVRSDIERQGLWTFGGGIQRGLFRRWSGDADTSRMDLEASRQWAMWAFNNQASSMGCWTTYHSITYTVSGTLYDYAGDGSGVTVELHDGDTGELLKTTTSAVGGSFSFDWHDDSRNLYCSAREDATHTGRSNTGSAS